MTDGNGETDPERERIEFYECSAGHQFREVLDPIQ